jgi:Tat protein translocase TatC
MAEADPFEHTRMTLGEHLEELRRRLFIGLGAIAVVFFVTWAFNEQATRIVLRPYDRMTAMLEEYYTDHYEEKLAADPELARSDYFELVGDEERLILLRDKRMTAVAPGEGFFFTLKVCVYIALFVGAPVLLYQLWMFVAAGLYRREQRVVRRYFPAAMVLFVGGVLFGYYLLVPYGMYFLNRTTSIELVRPDFRLSEYWTFLNSLCLGLGLVFQLPIVMVVLARLDIVPPRLFAKYRGHTWVGAVVVAAFLTPPDPFTQGMMAIPVIVLYELGIVCARWTAQKKAPA